MWSEVSHQMCWFWRDSSAGQVTQFVGGMDHLRIYKAICGSLLLVLGLGPLEANHSSGQDLSLLMPDLGIVCCFSAEIGCHLCLAWDCVARSAGHARPAVLVWSW